VSEIDEGAIRERDAELSEADAAWVPGAADRRALLTLLDAERATAEKLRVDIDLAQSCISMHERQSRALMPRIEAAEECEKEMRRLTNGERGCQAPSEHRRQR
jgi:hypothetical protein